jgi:hypothetical protein
MSMVLEVNNIYLSSNYLTFLALLIVHLCRMAGARGYRLLDEFYDKNHRARAIEDNPRLVRYKLLN